MTLFSDQLSAVRQAQLQAQLDIFRTLTSRALDNAAQIAALNVRTSRASIEQAAGTMKHLLEVRDPRDLFALGTDAQGQWHTLFSYGRELFGLAIGARALPATIPLLAAPTVNVPTTYTQVIEQASIAADTATTITGEIAAAAADIGAAQAEAALDAGSAARAQAAPVAKAQREPESTAADAQLAAAEAAIDTAIADEVPPAEPKPLAKALNEIAPKPAGAEHPLASTVALAAEGQVELPTIAPQENVAPPKHAAPPKPPRVSRRK